MYTKRIYWTLFVLMAFLIGCGDELGTFQELVTELDQTEQEIRSKQEEIHKKVQAYNAAHPDKPIDTSSLDKMMLDPSQAEELSRLLGEEKNVSYQGLVKELVEARKQIDTLQERARSLQERLPAPYTVREGDTHVEVALRYLMENHQVSAQQARELVEQTALVEELHEGFQIWMLYQEGTFGTYVTQGTSKVSPGRAQRLARQRIAQQITNLTQERDTARFISDSLRVVQADLEENLVFLRDEQSRLASEIAALKQAREEALAQMQISEQQRQDLEKRVNSLLYEVDTMESWKDKKVIKDPFFGGPRVESLDQVAFSMAQDLRESSTLTFEVSEFPNLKRIKRVEVYPRAFKEGQEYAVSVDETGTQAQVQILKPDAFAGQKVIFALR
jgi:hypothetical protein